MKLFLISAPGEIPRYSAAVSLSIVRRVVGAVRKNNQFSVTQARACMHITHVRSNNGRSLQHIKKRRRRRNRQCIASAITHVLGKCFAQRPFCPETLKKQAHRADTWPTCFPNDLCVLVCNLNSSLLLRRRPTPHSPTAHFV